MGQAFGCLQVDESTLAVKEMCGKYKGMLEPGCHCLPWCLCHQVAGKVSLRVQQLDVCCEAKTKDDDFVNVVASIQYRVMEGKDKAKDAFYKLSNPKGLIQAYVFDVIRASVSERTRDSAVEQKNDIANAVTAKHQEAMSAYGFEIVQTLIVDIEPYTTVKWAMNEKNAAAIKSAAQNEKLEVEKILQIKQAEGSTQVEKIWHIKQTEGKTQVEKILQIKRAEGEAEAEKISPIRRAEGEAEAEKISPIKRAEGEAEAEKISPIKQDEGKAEAEKILQIKQAEGSAQVEKIWRIKQTEGKTQVEKISPIKRAKGEAEAEKISPIKRAEGEAEAEKISPIKRAEERG